MELSKLIKECQETLKRNMSYETFKKAIEEVKQDSALCCYFKFYNDTENQDYCVAIGTDEENFLVYKFGIIGSYTMVIDYDDIIMPYSIENQSLLDTECSIDDSIITEDFYNYIVTKEVENFITYCYEQDQGLFEELFI